MFNADYKVFVFAQLMKQPMLPLLPKLIGPYQTYNVPGRSIFDNLHFLCDNVEINGALLSVKQAGAFNNVDLTYMDGVLESFGFPSRLRKYIKIMYNQINILVNTGGDTCTIRDGCQAR